MSRASKIHGLSTPHLGRVGDDMVLFHRQVVLVAVPGSQVYDYLKAMPLDTLELEYDESLFTRWIPGLGYEHFYQPDYRYGVYWDAVVILGLIPGIGFIVPNDPDLQSALLLGRGMVMRIHSEWFAPYTATGWHPGHIQLPHCERVEIPPVQWTEHTF